MKRRLIRLLQILVALAAAGFLVQCFWAIDAASHSASDTLRPWLIEVAVVGLVAVVILVALDRVARRAIG